MKRKKKSHRAIYGLMGAVVAATTIGTVAARDIKPYKAPELRLVQGSVDYDLTEGITYDNKKYELMVEDTGDFDIEVLGRYDVEYSLTPLDEETTSASDNTGVSKNDDPDFDSAFTVGSEETEAASSHTDMELESIQSEAKAEPKKEKLFTRLLGNLTGHAYAAEVEETGAGTLEENGFSTTPVETDLPEATKTESETEANPEQNASLATPSDAEGGTLDDIDGIIYFSRVVRVVASDYSNIKFDDPHLEIPSSADLYGIQIQGRIPVASDSNAEPNEGGAEGVEYKLFLKNPDLILGDVAFTDADGKKVKKVRVTVKNDEELKSAVIVESNEQGAPVITGMELGTYTVTLAAVDPDTEEEIICEREVHVVLNKCVIFDAPVLYIGTKNTSYDLTSRMLARDENGGPVEPIYVLNEEELLAAREEVQVKATPSNAEESTEETETGETETEETVTEVRLKKGTYHVTLGAKHPVSGDEFTVEREVRVVDGYYIYAPTLEIAAGSTDYDLLQGVEVKNDEGTTVDVEVKLKDASELLKAAEEFETMSAESTEDENNFAADMVEMYSENSADEKVLSGNPPLKEGSYSITLTANDPDTGEEIITNRQVSARATGYWLDAYLAKENGRQQHSLNYGLTLPDYDYNGGVYSKDERVYSGTINGRFENRVYVYKINEAKLHSLAVLGGYRETFWSNSSSGRGSNWEIKSSTKGNWKNSFGDAPYGLINDNADAEVKSHRPLDVAFFKQFNELPKWFSDWQTERCAIRVDGNWNNIGYTTQGDGDYGGKNSPIVIPRGHFGLQSFLLALSKDVKQVPYQDLYFKLTDTSQTPNIYLSLKYIEVPEHDVSAGIGQYTKKEYDTRPRSGTIHVLGNGGSGYEYVEVRTGGGTQGKCPNYVIENTGTVKMKAEYSGFDSAFMLNNVGNVEFNGNGYSNTVQSMILREKATLTLQGGGELKFQKAVADLRPTDGVDDSKRGVLKAGLIKLDGADVKMFKANIRKVDEPLITLLSYKEKWGETYYDQNGYMVSNGYVIKATKQGDTPFVPDETFAHTTSEKYVLDATNFYVANPDEKSTTATVKDTLYFTSKNHGKTIVTTTLPTWPICVKNNNDDNDINYFRTYTEALNSLNTKSGIYTITNLVEREFTKEDATTLKNFNNEKVELIFSSGKRPQNDADIDHGYYRVRMRKRLLDLPAKVRLTFKNIVLKYAEGTQREGGNDNLAFFNNGGYLTFGTDVYFLAGDSDSIGKAVVYGGSYNGSTSEDVHISISSGTYRMVYGGCGDSGSQTGETIITIDGTTTIDETLSGGNFHTNNNKQKDNPDKKTKITINSPLNVQNIYDYDELTIGVTGTDPVTKENKNVTVSQTFNSQRASGYEGVTILKGGSELVLSGNSTSYVRQMGRLKLASDAQENAKLSFARTSGNAKNTSNSNLVRLRQPDPLYMVEDQNVNKKHRIEVGYSSKNPAVGDIVLYLPGVPDTAEDKAKQVSTDRLKDCFVNTEGKHLDSKGKFVVMIAKPEQRTIELIDKSVGLSIKQNDDTYSIPETFITLKEALDALTAYENENGKSGRSYRITIFADGYEFSEADKTAMGSMRTTTANEILWTSKVGPDGGDLGTAGTVLPAGDLTFFGKKSIVEGMTLKFKAQNSIYADGKPLEISNGVNISGGTGTFKPDLYGGSGTQEVIGNTNLTVLSGEFRNIYAGGNGQKVTGNTSLIMKGGLATSVYGGGNGGEVTGDSSVSMEVPNKAAEGGNTGKTEFTFTDISGEGTVKDGALTPSVTGTKTVSVVPKDKNTDLKVHVSNLTGFDQLTLGNATGNITYANQQFRIKTRFDSSLTDGGTNRSDNVHLNRSALVLECGSGHIGNLNTQKVCALVIKRENDVTAQKDVTRPLLIDGQVTVSSTEKPSAEGVGVTKVYDKIKLMYVDEKVSTDGDVMVTYSSKDHTKDTEAIFYEDGTAGNLPTQKMDRDNGTSDIILSSKKAHTIEGEVIYPDDSRIEDASKPSENISKFIVVNYDPKNEHEVAGGYVVKIPKDKITDKTYTENWMKKDNTYDQKLTLTEGTEIFKLKFTSTKDRNGSKGKTEVPVPIDTENFFYVAHVICKNEDKSSLLLDVTAPRQSKTSGDAFGDYEGDGVNGTYHIHGDSSDYNITDKNLLPNAPSDFQSLGTKLTYTPHGVKLAAWSFGGADGNEAFEKEVAKADFGDDKNNIPEGLHLIDKASAVDGVACDIDFDIPQKDVETAIAAGQKYLVVYVKDKVNNTAKYIIPMSDSMIDVEVPMSVSLVAIKKSGTGLGVDACELLAPTCYIVNYGRNKVKVEVAKFEADKTKTLKLVEGNNTTTYEANQIALHLKDTGNGLATNAGGTDENTKFNLRNVLSIVDEKGKRAFLGDLKPKSEDGHTLDFTFGAYYDPVNIQETEDWLTNTMSYHFSVVTTTTPDPNPNQ